MTSSNLRKQKRRERKERNIQKELTYKKEKWENGKLIEENHNNKYYSEEYSIELGNRLYNIIESIKSSCKEIPIESVNEIFIGRFLLYKNKIRDFILFYNPNIKKSNEYNYLKKLLENYWDNKNNLYFNL